MLLEHVWREVLPGVPLPGRIGLLAGVEARLDGTTHGNQEHRGAETMRHLNMTPESIEAVANLNERWDGSGGPARKRGEQIPHLARICAANARRLRL